MSQSIDTSARHYAAQPPVPTASPQVGYLPSDTTKAVTADTEADDSENTLSGFERFRYQFDPIYRQATDERKLETTIAEREQELQDLSDGLDGIQPVIINLNQRGGVGKSRDSSISATTIGEVTGQMVTVIDNNQTKGTTLRYLGIKKSLGIREAMDLFSNNAPMEEIIRYLGHHPMYRNVYAIDSDTADKRSGRPIDPREYADFSINLKRSCSALIFDNGNEVDGSQTEVGAAMADVLRFVAMPSVDDATSLGRDTMEHLKTAFPEKVKNSVIVLTGCQERDFNLNYWSDYFEHPSEQISLVPYDPICESSGGLKTGSPERKVWVVRNHELQRRTYLANLDKEILTYRQAKIEIDRKRAEKAAKKADAARVAAQTQGPASH